MSEVVEDDKKNDDVASFKKQVLLKEYEMLRQLMEKHDIQITQLRAILIGSLGIYFGWIFRDLKCMNELKDLPWILFFIPLLITLLFAFNESFIQYWKHKAVFRFKYIESRLEDRLGYLMGIKGPHMRLSKREEEIVERGYYDSEGLCEKAKEIFEIGYYSLFYGPILILMIIFFVWRVGLGEIIQNLFIDMIIIISMNWLAIVEFLLVALTVFLVFFACKQNLIARTNLQQTVMPYLFIRLSNDSTLQVKIRDGIALKIKCKITANGVPLDVEGWNGWKEWGAAVPPKGFELCIDECDVKKYIEKQPENEPLEFEGHFIYYSVFEDEYECKYTVIFRGGTKPVYNAKFPKLPWRRSWWRCF